MGKSAIVLAACLFLSACGHERDRAPETGPLHETLTGSVSDALKSVQNGRFREDCDLNFADMQNEIATQLDSRTLDIQCIAKAPPPSTRRIPTGPTFFMESDFVRGEDRWVTSTKSWQPLFAYYRTIKDSPTDTRWVTLDSWVRSILVDDLSRTVRGTDTGLDHQAGEKLKALKAFVQSALNNNTTPLNLSEDLQTLVDSNLRLRNLWRQALRADARGRVPALQSLLARIETNLLRFEFYVNPTINRGQRGPCRLTRR